MSEAIAVSEPQTEVSVDQYKLMMLQAKHAVESGLLPSAINTPQKAVIIMQKGRELGIPPLYALSNIVVVNGKPTASAELMLALIYRDHGDAAMRMTEITDDHCTFHYRRRSWEQPETFTFSMADADTAGLAGKGTWKQYPKAMLRARCISAIARLAFPDTIGGLYTSEELGLSVMVNPETDEVTVAAEVVDEKPQLTEAQRTGTYDVREETQSMAQAANQTISPAQAHRLLTLRHSLGLDDEDDSGMSYGAAAKKIADLEAEASRNPGGTSLGEGYLKGLVEELAALRSGDADHEVTPQEVESEVNKRCQIPTGLYAAPDALRDRAEKWLKSEIGKQKRKGAST